MSLSGSLAGSLAGSLGGSLAGGGDPLHALGDVVVDYNANKIGSLTFRGATDFVSAWANAGSSVDAVQSTEARQPEYQSAVAALNNAPSVQFTAASQHFLDMAGISEAAGDWTIIWAGLTITGSADSRIIDTATGRIICTTDRSSGGANTSYFDGGWRVGPSSQFDTAEVITWELKSSASGRIRRDGSDQATGLSYATPRALSGNTKLGADNAVGTASNFDGHFNRFAIFRGTLSAADLTAAESIMGSPIGVTI